jgi:two-component system chemotaxis sensor kinase CheA
LERTARDTAQALGKRVVFEGKGHQVRLDAHVLAVLQGALVQLVRNSVAHGIESESARRAAGKSPAGRLRVEVSRRGKRVAFVCADDGRGVDVDAIRQAAQRKGLLAAETRELSPGKLLELLLEGGISTSGSITEVSGRGIGLDVVREAAERLGGEVSVDSKAATGTTVEIVVPVSLSSLDVLTVEASGICVAIPLDAVRTTLRIKTGEVTHAPEGESVLYGGMVIPFMPLERALKDNGRTARMAPSWSAVVVHKGAALAAVGVDRLLGTANVVLRPPPEFAHADPIVAGAFLDAQGDPQVVLDAEGLIAQARRSFKWSVYERPERLPVLVIDDSLTTRMLERSILEAAGYEVDVATSGEEALEKACRRNYALFLVDVEMPGMDGFTFVERAQNDPMLRHVPAVMVTSRASPEDRQRGQDAGARAYIVKSEFDQTDLLEKIRGVAG